MVIIAKKLNKEVEVTKLYESVRDKLKKLTPEALIGKHIDWFLLFIWDVFFKTLVLTLIGTVLFIKLDIPLVILFLAVVLYFAVNFITVYKDYRKEYQYTEERISFVQKVMSGKIDTNVIPVIPFSEDSNSVTNLLQKKINKINKKTRKKYKVIEDYVKVQESVIDSVFFDKKALYICCKDDSEDDTRVYYKFKKFKAIISSSNFSQIEYKDGEIIYYEGEEKNEL